MSNIGLVDVDGHNFPNLALMKISRLHKLCGDNVEFATMFNHYDVLYKSKVFTFTPDDEYCYNADKIIKGGTGYDIKSRLTNEYDQMTPDYSLYNCEHAYGFLTRGCSNKCPWCIVPEKEGEIKPYDTINNIIQDKKTAVLMDNNVLASNHGIMQIEEIIKLGIRVDFNQGLDCRLIDDSIAKLLSKVKWLHPVRLACDTDGAIKPLHRAVELLRWYNCRPERYFVYVLVDDINDAQKRVKYLKGMALDPFCQAYRDIKNNNPPTREQEDFCRWVNHKSIFKSVVWDEYI